MNQKMLASGYQRPHVRYDVGLKQNLGTFLPLEVEAAAESTHRGPFHDVSAFRNGELIYRRREWVCAPRKYWNGKSIGGVKEIGQPWQRRRAREIHSDPSRPHRLN